VKYQYQADLWPHRDFIAKRIARKMTNHQIARALVSASHRHCYAIEVWKPNYGRRDLEIDIAALREEIKIGVRRFRRPKQRRRRCPGESFLTTRLIDDSRRAKFVLQIEEGADLDFAHAVQSCLRGNSRPLGRFMRSRCLTDQQHAVVTELLRFGFLLDATGKVVALARRLLPWAKRRNHGKVRWGGLRHVLAGAYERLLHDGEDLAGYDVDRAVEILKRHPANRGSRMTR
jgi:hypothetical protein